MNRTKLQMWTPKNVSRSLDGDFYEMEMKEGVSLCAFLQGNGKAEACLVRIDDPDEYEKLQYGADQQLGWLAAVYAMTAGYGKEEV